MVTIARIKSTEKTGLLVGTGFGAFQSEGEDGGFRTGQVAYVALAREDGTLNWVPSDDVEILSIGGKPPAHWLGGNSR